MSNQDDAGDALEMALESVARVSCVSAGKPRSHELVAKLQAKSPNVRKGGFSQAVKSALRCDYCYFWAKGIVPDAWSVDHESRVFHIIEIADTHPINSIKGQMIGDLADEMLGSDWDLQVVVYNYAGGITCDIPGWCFMSVYTGQFSTGNEKDVTPAAMAIHRAHHSGGPDTIEDLDAAVRLLRY